MDSADEGMRNDYNAFASMIIALAAALYSSCQLEETDMIPSSNYRQPYADSFQSNYPWFPLNNLDYALFAQVWLSLNFGYPFDSSWFCRQ